MLWLAGCDSTTDQSSEADSSEPKVVRKVTLDLLVIDDGQLGSVIKRQFSSRRNGVANLTELSWQELVDQDFKAAKECDLIVYPANRLGELATRDLLVPITEENARLEENSDRALLFSDRGQVVSWGSRQLAFSLGQSHWVMLYRSDVLDAVGAKPPETWEQFDKLVQKIKDSETDNMLPDQVLIPIKDHWAGHSMIVR